MYDSTNTGGRKKRWAAAVGLLAVGAIGGGVLASALSASAATATGAASASSLASSPASGHGMPANPGGPRPVRSDEKTVTGATAATLRTEALKAVPGGTVYRIETDAGDGVYEAHMKRADSTLVTVKFGRNLKVIKVESGMGAGDPRLGGHVGPGAPGAPGGAGTAA